MPQVSLCDHDPMLLDEGTATGGLPGERTPPVQTKGLAALLLIQTGFQGCLAAGVPWGRAAYGGQHSGTLPSRYRCVSAVGAVAYAVTAFTLARGGGSGQRQRALLSGVTAMMAMGTLLNAISRSPLERGLWTPYCALTGALAWRARRLVGQAVSRES